MPHAQGDKMSRRHTTLIEAAVGIVRTARALACVTKISLGKITQVVGRTAERRLKIMNVPAGLFVKVRGTKTLQELFIYTADQRTATQAITAAFRKGRKKNSAGS